MSRTAWGLLLAIAAGSALTLAAADVTAQTVVKVGLINSYTGFVAQAGDQAQKAIDLYIKEHERELPPGVKLEIVRRDDTSNPEVGKRLAQELIAREHVQLLTGGIPSIQATALMKAVKDLELREAGIHITSAQDLLPDEQMPAIGDSALDLITAGTYSIAGKRPANEAFLATWKRAYGESVIPDFLSVDAWDGMVAIFDLIKATNGKFTADEAMAFFKTWKNPDSPRGPISIDPETRDIVQNIYIRRVEKVEGQVVNVEIATIP